jgi:hypothetical protein
MGWDEVFYGRLLRVMWIGRGTRRERKKGVLMGFCVFQATLLGGCH